MVSLEIAAEIGIADAEFWQLTPYLFFLRAEVHGEKMLRQRLAEVSQAWTIASYSRRERLPRLAAELKRMEKIARGAVKASPQKIDAKRKPDEDAIFAQMMAHNERVRAARARGIHDESS